MSWTDDRSEYERQKAAEFSAKIRAGKFLSEPQPADFNDKVKFSSGATSGGKSTPYVFMTWAGVKRTALRFWYGNQKHENGQTVLADANWLKAFHSRDLEFFRDRMAHAIDHIQAEMQGRFETTPGGNWGAVGWCTEVMPFVEENDREFYLAIVGLLPHPGERKESCKCPRCEAASYLKEPNYAGQG